MRLRESALFVAKTNPQGLLPYWGSLRQGRKLEKKRRIRARAFPGPQRRGARAPSFCVFIHLGGPKTRGDTTEVVPFQSHEFFRSL
jgi:hypothetical protein